MTTAQTQLNEKIDFGQTGLRVSRLAIGTGTNGWSGRSDQGDKGTAWLADLLQQAYARGVNFWDTADAYGTHPHVGRALKKLPRQNIVVITKTLARTHQAAQDDIERFLNELQTEYIDIVLLHALTSSSWPQDYAEAMQALSAAQAAGKIKAVGISSHGLGALKAAAESDWAEVVMARINYAGVNMDASTDTVVPIIAQMHAAGKAVYGMKIMGNGKLGHDPRKAIEFAFSLRTIPAMTIGMLSETEMSQTIHLAGEYARKYPVLPR